MPASTASNLRHRSRAVNRRVQGDIGEASAIEWLTSQGALVWVPLGHSPHVDLLAELGERLLRVQVKTSTARTRTPHGAERWKVSIKTNGGNQSWNREVKRFDPDKVDFLFALVGDGRRWLVPASAIAARTEIALGAPAYAEFEIEPGAALDRVVYPDSSTSLELPSP